MEQVARSREQVAGKGESDWMTQEDRAMPPAGTLLREMPLDNFLTLLSSDAPAPGGGSVSALAGAISAALLEMVCRLTVGRPRYAAADAYLRPLLAQMPNLRQQLLQWMDDDTAAYHRVMAAYALPKGNDSEKAARQAAIQAALQDATEVPLQVAAACATLLDYAQTVIEQGNPNAASDGAVGALLAEAGLRGAALNVLINLGGIHDQVFAATTRERLDALLAGRAALKEAILQAVQQRLTGASQAATATVSL